MIASEVQDEIEVLQAIHLDDFSSLPQVWHFPCFEIKINSYSEVFIKLRFTLNKGYPKLVPKLDIESYNGVSKIKKSEILKLLQEYSKTLVGNVMIHDIVLYAKSLLDDIPLPQSLYDLSIARENRERLALDSMRNGPVVNITPSIKLTLDNKLISSNSLQAKSKSPQIKKAYNCDNRKVESTAIDSIVNEVDELSPMKENLEISDDEDLAFSHDDDDFFDILLHENTSRYKSEFMNLELLGKGASGSVFKVRNILDKRLYAIKRILLDSRKESLNRKIRREVTTLSRLFHKNCVRYYSAWIENEDVSDLSQIEEVNSSSTSIIRTNNGGSDSSATPETNASKLTLNKNENFINFSKQYLNNEYFQSAPDNDKYMNNDYFEFEYEDGVESNSFFVDDDDDGSGEFQSDYSSDSDSESESSDSETANPVVLQKSVTQSVQDPMNTVRNHFKRCLYIQMEYCPNTLRGLIDSENLWQSPSEIFSLFRQTLDGLEYIHKRGLLHRDLKPANIFIDQNRQIKIGDFGLATFNKSHGNISSDNLLSVGDGSIHLIASDIKGSTNTAPYNEFADSFGSVSGLTDGVGTAIYRAPEQEESNKLTSKYMPQKYKYDDKADIYSLGIILFEMCHKPFSTGMERITEIKNLREKQSLPKEFLAYNPSELTSLILWLVKSIPIERPTASQVLKSKLLPHRIDTDMRYLKKILHQDMNSDTLRNVIKALMQRGVEVYRDTNESDRVLYDTDYVAALKNKLQVRRLYPIRSPKSVVSSELQSILNGINRYKDALVIPLHLLTFVSDYLSSTFQSYGAINLEPSLFQSNHIRSHLFDVFVCNPTYLDKCGNVVSLSSDLIRPIAQTVSILNPSSMQLYNIGRVYVNHNDEVPKSVNEAVYCVIYRTQRQSLVNASPLAVPQISDNFAVHKAAELNNFTRKNIIAEQQVLLTVCQLCKGLKSHLPTLCIRLVDYRILDAIIQLAELSYQYYSTHKSIIADSNQKNQPKNPISKQNNETIKEELETLSMKEKENINILFSRYCDFTSFETAKDFFSPPSKYDKTSILDNVLDQLLVYYKILWESVHGVSTLNESVNVDVCQNPFKLLQLIEEAFYNSPVIANIKRELASHNKSSTSFADSVVKMHTEPPVKQGADVKTSQKLGIQKVEIDFKSIGMPKKNTGKSNKSKDSALSGSKVAFSEKTHISNLPAQNDVFVKKLEMIVRQFDLSVSHLRQVLGQSYSILDASCKIAGYSNDKKLSVNSILEQLGQFQDFSKLSHPLTNSKNENPDVLVSNGWNDIVDNFSSSVFPIPVRVDLFQSLPVLHSQGNTDTGTDTGPCHVTRNSNHPFNNSVFRFIVEVQHKFDIGVSNKLSAKLKRSVHRDIKGLLDVYHNIVIIEGGHFDSLLDTTTARLHGVGTQVSWVAVGARVRIDTLINQLLKYDKKELLALSKVTDNAKSGFNVQSSLSSVLANHCLPQVVIISREKPEYNESNSTNPSQTNNKHENRLEHACNSDIFEQFILALLRQFNIRVTNEFHELIFGLDPQLFSSTKQSSESIVDKSWHTFFSEMPLLSKVSFCHRYGIPLVVVLPYYSQPEVKTVNQSVNWEIDSNIEVYPRWLQKRQSHTSHQGNQTLRQGSNHIGCKYYELAYTVKSLLDQYYHATDNSIFKMCSSSHSNFLSNARPLSGIIDNDKSSFNCSVINDLKPSSISAMTISSKDVQSTDKSVKSTKNFQPNSSFISNVNYTRTVNLKIIDVHSIVTMMSTGTIAGNTAIVSSQTGKSKNVNVKKVTMHIEKQIKSFFVANILQIRNSNSIELRLLPFPTITNSPGGMISSPKDLDSFSENEWGDYRVLACDISYLVIRGFTVQFFKFISSTGTSQSLAMQEFCTFFETSGYRRVLKQVLTELMQLKETCSQQFIGIYLFSTCDNQIDLLTYDVHALHARKFILSHL